MANTFRQDTYRPATVQSYVAMAFISAVAVSKLTPGFNRATTPNTWAVRFPAHCEVKDIGIQNCCWSWLNEMPPDVVGHPG